MFQLTALYNQPEDPAAFDQHYDNVHADLGKKMPGLQRFTINRPGPDPDGNPPPYYFVAVLEWDPPRTLPGARQRRRDRRRWPTCPTSPAPAITC